MRARPEKLPKSDIAEKKLLWREREIKRELRERGERDNLGQAGGTLGLQRTTTEEQAGL